MKHKALPLFAVALAIAFPLSADARGDKPADPASAQGEKPEYANRIQRNTADSLGVDEEDLTLSDFEREDDKMRYKAKLADGTQYRCYVTVPSKLLRVMSFGRGDGLSDAMCTKKVGSGKGPEPAKNALLEAAGR